MSTLISHSLFPKSFLAREEEMAAGFAKECAVVTHYRLKTVPGQGLVVDPDSKLEEELVVRPTSETIIWNTYRHWIQSYRDLPLLINQWANVVRWEMRTRLFLRTAEFLWQEGHTAHATQKEAEEEAHRMLEVYRSFAEDWMAMPVLTGPKTEGQKFPGAIYTLCIEAMMQDRRALQAGTSHFLGQNFAKAFDVKFQNQHGELEYAWATSWGVSTRLIGGLIMTHSDDQGLVLPPRVSPIHAVIVPIFKKPEEKEQVLAAAHRLATALKQGVEKQLHSWLNFEPVVVKVDDREQYQPGFKFNEWELRGVPIRIELGPKDLANESCVLARRDIPGKEGKEMGISLSAAPARMAELLQEIQKNLFQRAKKFRDDNSYEVNSYDEFKEKIENPGGFLWAHWDGTRETEDRIAAETKATIRCVPFHRPDEKGKCILTGRPSQGRVVFAKAY
ncbi:MAG: proline--tRNA ligase [Gemmatales bacterium]|nr:MAG: proline--tRNA ligase [Gemmatales bacterium]